MRSGDLLHAPSAKPRSAGASKTGLPPTMTRVETLPASMSAASSRERGRLVGRPAGDGLGVGDGLAGVAERLVDRVRERVHGGRLRLAGERRGPLPRCAFRSAATAATKGSGRRAPTAIAPTAAATARAKASISAGRHRAAVVRARARERRRRLDDVEPVGVLAAAARREVAHRRAAWPGPMPRKSASSDRMTSARSKA